MSVMGVGHKAGAGVGGYLVLTVALSCIFSPLYRITSDSYSAFLTAGIVMAVVGFSLNLATAFQMLKTHKKGYAGDCGAVWNSGVCDASRRQAPVQLWAGADYGTRRHRGCEAVCKGRKSLSRKPVRRCIQGIQTEGIDKVLAWQAYSLASESYELCSRELKEGIDNGSNRRYIQKQSTHKSLRRRLGGRYR